MSYPMGLTYLGVGGGAAVGFAAGSGVGDGVGAGLGVGSAVGTPVGVGDSTGAAVGVDRVTGIGIEGCSRVTVGRGVGWEEGVAVLAGTTGAEVAAALVPQAAANADRAIKNPMNIAFIEHRMIKL